MSVLSAFVVNLDEDDELFRKLGAQVSDLPWLRLRRISGFHGSLLPDTVCLNSTNDPNSLNNKGALGCFFSHVIAWQEISRLTDPYALVLEDDILVRHLGSLSKYSLPPGFDLIFCNDRVQPDFETGAGIAQWRSYPVTAALGRIARRGRAVGTDGYLLTPAGARKLLEFVRRDFYFGHIDMRLLAYSLSESDVDKFGPDTALGKAVRTLHHTAKRAEALQSYCLYPALVEHTYQQGARIREDTRGGHSAGAP